MLRHTGPVFTVNVGTPLELELVVKQCAGYECLAGEGATAVVPCEKFLEAPPAPSWTCFWPRPSQLVEGAVPL